MLDGVGAVAAACSLLPTLFCGAGAGPFAGKHCQYLCMHSEFSEHLLTMQPVRHAYTTVPILPELEEFTVMSY